MYRLLKHVIVYILRAEARAVLKKYKPHIVAVTGSVGKTSTKDAIYSVLSHTRHVRKSEKSFNSEIGLPLTILGRPNAWHNPLGWLQNIIDGLMLIVLPSKYPEWLVLEVGADRPGDISSLASWLRVDVAVITRLPEVPVHVEFFDSPQAVVEEKASLINALKEGGSLLLYGDDERTRMLASRARERSLVVRTFGMSHECDVQGFDVSLLTEKGSEWPTGMQARISVLGETIAVVVPGVVGSHAFLSLVAAAAVGERLGLTPQHIAEGLSSYEPPKGRMRLIPGIKKTHIIDDTYNSSPAAVEAALLALSDMAKGKGRRIAVLGDMMELGRLSVDEHKRIGAVAAKTVDVLLTIGFRARDIASSALDHGLSDAAIFQYEDAARAGKELQNMLKEHDCVLVKGSQSMRMEAVVEDIMLEPERAEEFLVRQDSEWKKR